MSNSEPFSLVSIVAHTTYNFDSAEKPQEIIKVLFVKIYKINLSYMSQEFFW